MVMKNPLTLAGIEPATFRFVTHCATAVPDVEGLEKRNIREEGGVFYLKTLLVVKNA